MRLALLEWPASPVVSIAIVFAVFEFAPGDRGRVTMATYEESQKI